MKIQKHYQIPNYSKVVTSIAEIRQSNIKIEEQLSKITELYNEKISFDELKNKQFEIVVEELQRYKNNFIFDTIQKRIYLELIGIYDHVEELLKLSNSDLSKEDIIQHLSSFKKQIIQILNNQGVEQIFTKGNKFDPKYQEAVDVVNTEKPEEDQVIEDVFAKGFIYDNKKILRPQKVVVKKYSNKKGGLNG
jgi:molecular chaperone GrpE (heat shock protein)